MGSCEICPCVDRDSPDWGVRRMNYALDYARALALQRRGEAVVVYMDESYVRGTKRQ